MFAKELLLQCMVKSVDVLEGILDGFLAISTDISQTAKALGPSPSTYAYLKGIPSDSPNSNGKQIENTSRITLQRLYRKRN